LTPERISRPRRATVRGRQALALAIVAVIAGVLVGALRSGPSAPHHRAANAPPHRSKGTAVASTPLGAKPPVAPPLDIYSADRANALSPVVQGDPALVYVPNSMSNTVTVISQQTMHVVAQFPTGELPQHVTPSYDLRTLYVDNDLGNTLTPIDPRTGKPGQPVKVEDPYNLYFTPDGRYAIVVAERLQLLDFRDPHTMHLVDSLSVPMCRGVDHMDFSADGRYLFASCEFAGRMIEVDLATKRVIHTLAIGNGLTSPQDVKLSPDGRTLYVADQLSGGLWEIDPVRFRVIGFLHTGAGAHGLYPSRDGQDMYVSNRAAGSVSVVSFATKRVIHKWQLPLPASPDMGGVSADGGTLWLSGRYDAIVYAIDTRTGRLRARIAVGLGPHGLCVWPQPGRYSLGHTGIMR
jgi:YVTN family beta-propeller protein